MENDFLLIDEPTNHLDMHARECVKEYLCGKKGFILVSHDRDILDACIDHVLVLNRKTIEVQSRVTQYERRMEREIQEKEGLLQDVEQPVSLKLMPLSYHKELLISCRELSVRYEGAESDTLKNLTFELMHGERVFLHGENGCGKSTLLKIINGIIKPDVGTIEIGQTIKIGYFSQENEYMDESKRVIDYVKEAGEYIATSDGKITASQMLERFLFDGAMQWSRIEKLSGGEKRRLYLLRVLMEAPNVLILDEPTNDLDIQTLTILEDYLDHFDGIILIVSHDRYFLNRTVSRIFAFNGGGKIRQSEGGYSDYLIRVELEKPKDGQTIAENMSDAASAQTGESDSKKTWKQREKKLKFSYKEQREYETIDEDIAKLEEAIEKLDREMVKNATNSVKLSELMKEKEETEATLEEKMDRWVYLNDLAEQIENQ